MTRIVAGTFGGRRLVTPKTVATRPTSDRVREAIFARLDHVGVLTDARVLDLYAGSGALGLEALSRGAAYVTLVESARPAIAALKENVAALRVAQDVEVRGTTVEKLLANPAPEAYDLVLLDPPYDLAEDWLTHVLARLENGWLTPGAMVLVERRSRSPEPTWPASWERTAERRYGDTVVWTAQPVTSAT